MVMTIAACVMAPLRKGPVDIGKIPDGVYIGTAGSWLNQADVRVTVQGGMMTDILLTRHWASCIGRQAEPVVPDWGYADHIIYTPCVPSKTAKELKNPLYF
jgi:hypothetical protein